MVGKTMLYLAGSYILPRGAFGRLLRDRTQAVSGFAAVTGAGLLFALRALALGLTGAHPLTPALLPIPLENYYAWEALFSLPVFWMTWISTAGLVQAFGHVWRRGSEFRATLAVTGIAIAAASMVSWLPGAVGAIVMAAGSPQAEWAAVLSAPGPAQYFLIGLELLAVAWGFRLAYLAASMTQRMNRGQALLTGLVAEAWAVWNFILFIR